MYTYLYISIYPSLSRGLRLSRTNCRRQVNLFLYYVRELHSLTDLYRYDDFQENERLRPLEKNVLPNKLPSITPFIYSYP